MNLRAYLIGTIIVWIGVFTASAVVLSGSDVFPQMIPILGGAAFWSIVLAPTALRRGTS